MKRRVLVSLLVIAVVAGLVGASTFAYFSDTEESTGNVFTAGTIDLQLRNDGVGDWGDGVTATWSSPNWAPGDPEVLGELRMKNVGTTGAAVARICGENLAQPNSPYDMADHIHITTLAYTEDGSTYLGGPGMLAWYEGIFGDGDGTFTLAEFVESPYCMVFWVGDHPPTEDYLQAGGANIQKVKFGFTFESEAGNEYQGDSVSFDVVVTADDDTTISGKGSGCYGYR